MSSKFAYIIVINYNCVESADVFSYSDLNVN